MTWYEPWITINCPHCGGEVHIDKVDEDFIEESHMNDNFVEGDNWLHDQRQNEHPKYIPNHHIFLARGLWKIGMKKVLKILSHELFEVAMESKGLKYDPSHAEANWFETLVGKTIKPATPEGVE